MIKQVLVLLSSAFAVLLLWGCSKNEESQKYKLEVSSSPSEGGKVTPQSGEFNGGEKISILATPADGYSFKKWSGGLSSDRNPIEVVLTSDFKITAQFEAEDFDGDGVSSAQDQCPDTPEGEVVNENGCSDSQKDTDEDGVTDDLDNCPDSPENEEVDTQGCTANQNDKQAPIITEVDVSEISQTSFQVEWRLDEGSKGYIRFGTTSGVYVGSTAIATNFLSFHRQTVGNNNPFALNVNTVYFWQIYTEDQFGNTSFSEEYEIRTLEPTL